MPAEPNSNLNIWEKVRTAPPNALKEIKGGRMSGKSDINPIWRYRMLTEIFGPCGIGWYADNVEYRLEPAPNGEIAAFCSLTLYVCDTESGEWAKGIPAQGGSMFVANEKNGPYTNDDCFKMAYTDAMSVACKQLGFAADVYWEKGNDSKYGTRQTDDDPLGKEKSQPPKDAGTDCGVCGKPMTPAQRSLSQNKFGKLLCPECQKGEA